MHIEHTIKTSAGVRRAGPADFQDRLPAPIAAPAAQSDEIVGFSYDRLNDPTLAAELRASAGRIKENLNRTYFLVGRELNKAKVMLPHGMFLNWVKGEFRLTENTARNYMSAARLMDRLPADKTPTVEGLPPTVVYALAQHDAPLGVIYGVIDDIGAGRNWRATDICSHVSKLMAETEKVEAKTPQQIAVEKEKEGEAREHSKSAANKVVDLLKDRFGADGLTELFNHMSETDWREVRAVAVGRKLVRRFN